MTLELFTMDACPYCKRVMSFIEQTGRNDIIYRDIREDAKNREKLISIGKKEQVPCLFIDGEPLYESMDIIAWLQDHPQT